MRVRSNPGCGRSCLDMRPWWLLVDVEELSGGACYLMLRPSEKVDLEIRDDPLQIRKFSVIPNW